MRLAPTDVSAESQFITLCVREPEAVSPRALSEAAEAVQDWQSVAEVAQRHRVATYVLRAAARAGVALPEAVCERLSVESLAAQTQVMLLESELKRVLSTCVAAEVPVLVLKGPVLAPMLYREPGLRPYADLDLTVREDDVERAVAVLADSGYVELAYEAATAQRAHVGHLHDSGTFHRLFAGAGDRALIELHGDPLQLGLKPLCEQERWERARPIPGLPGGLMLGLEDQVVQLSVHAHKHGFSRLIWLKDLDLLLRHYSAGLDWHLVEEVARREGVGASVWYTLLLVHALLATPLPAATSRLAPRGVLRLLYAAMWPAARVANLGGFLRRRAVQFHAAESWHGMLPSLLLMGRRSVRLQMFIRVELDRCFRGLTRAAPLLLLGAFVQDLRGLRD